MDSIISTISGNMIMLIAVAFLGFVITLLIYIFFKRRSDSEGKINSLNRDLNLGVIVTDEIPEDEASYDEPDHYKDHIEYALSTEKEENLMDNEAVYLASFSDPFLTPLMEQVLEEEGIEPFLIESGYDPNRKLKEGEKLGYSYTRMYVHKGEWERASQILRDILEKIKKGEYDIIDKSFEGGDVDSF